MLAEALWRHRSVLAKDAPRLRAALDLIGRSSDLSVAQALMLSAAVHHIQPQIIIDLGTGQGNSAATFAVAGRRYGAHIFTFDMVPHWTVEALPLLNGGDAAPWGAVLPVVGDLTAYDFTKMAGVADRVLVFWDAHGFDIAEHVLGHLMPLIADKEHLVVCHDISDNRFLDEATWKDYGGKRFWRGMDDYYRRPERSSHVNLGWTTGIVDQVIPIIDFCARNDMELRSFDHELRRELDAEKRAEISQDLGDILSQHISMAYFTMNETESRRFPAPSRSFT